MRGRIARSDEATGIYHLTASGPTTWYQFAQRLAGERTRCIPVRTADYPRLRLGRAIRFSTRCAWMIRSAPRAVEEQWAWARDGLQPLVGAAITPHAPPAPATLRQRRASS